MRSRAPVVLLLSIGLLLILGFGYLLRVGSHPTPTNEPVQTAEASSPDAKPTLTQQQEKETLSDEIGKSRRNAITRTVAMVSPAVVGINVTEIQEYTYRDPFEDFFNDPFFRQFFGDRQRGPRKFRQEVKGLGSGFIISPDGYIVTNHHVAGKAKEIIVSLPGGAKEKAKLVGTDEVSDIALLKINGKNFPYLKLGNSDEIIIGEWAIAFGNPFGLIEAGQDNPIVTVGTISSTKMNLSSGDGRNYRGMVMTDAAINPGNSGGPLVNSAGEVIGMNTMIYTAGVSQAYIGYGFAIPVNRVKAIVANLKKKGKVDRDWWTGFSAQQVDESIARAAGLTRAEGMIVNEVEQRSPAAKAGLKVGDVLLEVNGEKITGEDALLGVMNNSKAGDVLHLKVLRDNKIMEIDLKLEKRSS
jgi:serine protease Do